MLSIQNTQRWRWKISERQFKWALTSRSFNCSIIGFLCILDFHPKSLNSSYCNPSKIALKSCSLPLFSHFLWMECCIPLKVCVDVLPHYIPKFIEKFNVPIWNDTLWYSKVHLGLSKEHFFLISSYVSSFYRTCECTYFLTYQTPCIFEWIVTYIQNTSWHHLKAIMSLLIFLIWILGIIFFKPTSSVIRESHHPFHQTHNMNSFLVL